MTIQENIELAPFTTIQLGGRAKYFCSCASEEELRDALFFAGRKKLRTHILGGGSNTIFLDEGFDGLVIKINFKGITFTDNGKEILVSAKAGEDWDSLVSLCAEQGYAGIECLSGIPGSVGAVPIQNVGAYGQEVKDTIEKVKVIHQSTFNRISFSKFDCRFSYRMSRFKREDAGKYIVTEVVFRLQKNGRPTTAYPEVKQTMESQLHLPSLADGKEALEAVRKTVLSLRRKKSMVIDANDMNTKSVGSFFLNPFVDNEQFSLMTERWKSAGNETVIPSFSSEGKIKLPAAWLIEKSGFHKGYTTQGAGISENHSLALVNRGGTTKDLLNLAKEIQEGVQEKFGVRLELEVNVIQ
ncbi:MAG: UDP-N-acetylmuramate dehydrogenase [Bacteroidetes bacterium]|nr:UDP-N-acetylmuramate dehydrogenase [Bacteroidota bacterium]